MLLALVTSRCHVSLQFRDDAYLDILDKSYHFTLMDPSSAVYATDEVNRVICLQNLNTDLFSVWKTVHHPSGTREENKDAWHRGDQGLFYSH